MATLSEVVRRRRELESRSRTSALVGGVGEKLKEKFDPRQMLNQTGILATLFPSLKAFQAKGRFDASDPRRASKATVVETQGVAMTKEVVVKLDKVIENTAVLPRIAKTMGTLLAITAQKATEGKSREQSKDFFQSAKIKEGQYESQFIKDDKSMQPTQVQAPKSGGMLSGILGGALGGLGKLAGIVGAVTGLSSLLGKTFGEKSMFSKFISSLSGKGGLLGVMMGLTASLGKLAKEGVGFVFKSMLSGGKAVAEGALKFGSKAFTFTKDIAKKLLMRIVPMLAMVLPPPALLAALGVGALAFLGKLAYDKFTGTNNTEAENTGTNADELEIPQKATTQGDQAQSGTQRRQGRGRYKPPTGGNASQNGAISGDRPTKAGGSGAGGGKISKFNQSGSASRGKSPTKSIPNRSVTGGKEGELLDFIASKESGGAGGYAAVYGVGPNPDILNMTVAEVMQYQDELIADGQKSSAMGRYQFIKSTLSEEAAAAGVDINKEVFSPHFQDALILHRLRRIRGLDKFMSGEMDKNQFGEELAKEFASMPQPSTGKSRYAGVAGNKALTTNEEVGNVLDNLRPENRSQNGAISGGKSSGASGTQQNTAKQGILERAMEAVSNVKDALFGGDGGATVINNNTNQNNVNNGGGGSKRPDIGDRNLENNLNPTSSYY